MENKTSVNIRLIILIILLVTALGILGGYLIYDKIIGKDNDIEKNNQDNYDMVEAEKLISNYLVKTAYGNDYITELDDESKTILAIERTSSSNYSCKQLYGESSYVESDNAYFVTNYKNIEFFCTNKNDTWSFSSQFYKYDDVLATKKILFGPESVLNKNTFDSSMLAFYHYNAKFDVYVSTYAAIGSADGPIPMVKNIFNYAKIVGDTLKIEITNIKAYPDYNNEYTVKDIIVETREYIFKHEDNNYYLYEIKELDA